MSKYENKKTWAVMPMFFRKSSLQEGGYEGAAAPSSIPLPFGEGAGGGGSFGVLTPEKYPFKICYVL